MNKKAITDENLINKACEQLAGELTASREFNDLQQAREQIENNKEAADLLDEYQKAMQMRQQMGGLDVFGDNKVEDIEAKMEENQIIKQYMTAEENWSTLLKNLFENSSRELDFDLLSALGGCC